MPRIQVSIPMAVLARADLAALMLQSDNMITRFRDIIIKNRYVAIALARIVAQVAYRLASERYQVDNENNLVIMTIELTIDELKAIAEHTERIIDELEQKMQHYKEMLNNKQCKNTTACEQRIAAIEAWLYIVGNLADAYYSKKYYYRVG